MDLDLKSILEDAGRLVARFGDEAYFIVLCVRSGLIGVELPHRVALMLRAFERFGTLGGAVSVAAIHSGGRVGLVDELGSLTFRELDRRSNALANAWRARGLEPGEGVTILARNHRGFVDAVFGGARILLLDDELRGAQLRRVASRTGTDLLVYDDEYAKVLASLDRNQASAMIVDPDMLRRMLDRDEGARAGLDLDALRVVLVAGPPLGGELARRATERLGPIVYELYGTEEIAFATIATPADLAAEPACVGRVVHGSVVRILDEHGEELPPGATGRIFVGDSARSGTPAGPGGKAGLLPSGDAGHFDSEGRLFIDGRGNPALVC